MRPSEDPGSIEVPVRAFSYDSGASGPELTRAIAVEAPVQIVIGGAPFAVMMATPRDLEDFACGFALTEQIADSLDDIRSVEVESVEEGWKLKIALSGARLQAHLARGRAMSGRTGCGLCGIEDFSQMPSPRPPLQPQAAVAPDAIRAALSELEARQPLNQATRAVHAAAWCGRDGTIVVSREDVGRHNALDKTIGALARGAIAPDSGFFVITSRCSFEMVAKAAIFGAGTLVSVSAPTSLALDRAQRFGVRLIAVARSDQALCFDGGKNDASGGLAA
ncbi:MAG TPA: formate dehydrogenase accessory sulfurtransferase FdhD [Roseiarcus sp.]|jgi:FdhD protein